MDPCAEGVEVARGGVAVGVGPPHPTSPTPPNTQAHTCGNLTSARSRVPFSCAARLSSRSLHHTQASLPGPSTSRLMGEYALSGEPSLQRRCQPASRPTGWRGESAVSTSRQAVISERGVPYTPPQPPHSAPSICPTPSTAHTAGRPGAAPALEDGLRGRRDLHLLGTAGTLGTAGARRRPCRPSRCCWPCKL